MQKQKMVKFAARLVAHDVVENFILNYPMKGHTHGPLDATFGQMCVKLSLAEFDDDMDVVGILNGFLQESGLDSGSRDGAQAYKFDEAPKWVEWSEAVELTMSNLTGPDAPHYFRITRRKCVGLGGPISDGAQELHASVDDRSYRPHPDDVVMVVKDLMASVEVSQVILLVPAADLPRLNGLPHTASRKTLPQDSSRGGP